MEIKNLDLKSIVVGIQENCSTEYPLSVVSQREIDKDHCHYRVAIPTSRASHNQIRVHKNTITKGNRPNKSVQNPA